MESILVASDLSERSRHAVRRAVQLAQDTDATLTVLHVVDEALPTDLATQVQIGAESILTEQITSDARDHNVNFTVKVVVGDAVEQISQSTESSKADLLVVGLHRRRKFLDQIRETTMEHQIRSSRIPVLLVAGPVEGGYAQVLNGIALSRACAVASRSLRVIAPNAKLTVFHAHEVSFRKEAERDFETWKAVYPLQSDLPDPIFVEAKPSDAVRDIMKDGSYDLLAIGGHTRSNTSRYVLGGFTSGLIRNPPCDLLIAK